MANIVYFSNVSNYTHRFILKLGLEAIRLPILSKEASSFTVEEPFVLITPTYGDAQFKNLVPRQVGRFLNNPDNRALMKAVIASGNTNFGAEYALAGEIISRKCNVPLLATFELMGTPYEVETIKQGLEKFWLQAQNTQTTLR